MNDIAFIQVVGKLKPSGYAVVDADMFPRLNVFRWNWGTGGYAQGWTRQDSNGTRRHLIMHKLVNQTPSGMKTDHRNGFRFDNRRINLRTATHQQSNFNRRKPAIDGLASVFKGVSRRPHQGSWTAKIGVDRKLKYIGDYPSEREAAAAYNRAAIHYFGEFANLNPV